MLLLLGILAIAFPTLLAIRVLWQLIRNFGAINGELVVQELRKFPELSLSQFWPLVRDNSLIQKSLIVRLLEPIQQEQHASRNRLQRTLAETVSQIECELVEHTQIPRIAASLATTVGLLTAALVMRKGLNSTIIADEPLSLFEGVIERGLTLAAIAFLGGLLCALCHKYAQQERRRRFRELDAIVEWIMSKL